MPSLQCPSPGNINPLRLTGFEFNIHKLPDLTYFVQSVELPPITLGVSSQSSSVHDIKIPGETMEYGSLAVEFQVDEEMKNWNGIYFWMIALGYPEGHSMYTRYMNSAINSNLWSELSKGYSDGSLTVLNSSGSPVQTFTYVDMFPTNLTGLRYDSRSTSPEIATATAVFEYTYYKMNKDFV